MDQDLLGVRAGRSGRQPGQIDVSMAAKERKGHDPRTGWQAPTGPGAVVDDLAAELVAVDDRLGRVADPVIATPGRDVGPFVAAVLCMEVRSADARAQDLKANLPFCRNGLWKLVDP